MNDYWELFKKTYQLLKIHSCLKSCVLFTIIWGEWTSVHILQSKNSVVLSRSILKLQSNFFHLQLSHFQLHIFCFSVKSTLMCLFPVEYALIIHMCSCWTELLRFFLLRLCPTLSKHCCTSLSPPVHQLRRNFIPLATSTSRTHTCRGHINCLGCDIWVHKDLSEHHPPVI